jgi:hypothetical protein
MKQVKRAALAPAEPSTQDRRVASSAQMKITQAQRELNAILREETKAKLASQDTSETQNDNKSSEGNDESNEDASSSSRLSIASEALSIHAANKAYASNKVA